MQLTDKQETEIKEWAAKRLEHISDAETDVLADYVVALCRTEGSIDAIKRNAVVELEDFLKDNTTNFVNDLFAKFIAQPAPLPTLSTQPARISNASFNPPIAPVRSGSIQMTPVPGQGVTTFDGGPQKRKRPYADRGEATSPNYARGQRPMKVMRGGPGGLGLVHGYGGRDERSSNQNGSGGFSPVTSMPPNQNGFAGFPHTNSMPYPMQLPTTSGAFPLQHSASPAPFSVAQHSPPSPFPFDPNDPMAAMMAMQAMSGFPPLQGMPQFKLPLSPVGAPLGRHRLSNGRFPPRHRLKPPCKDYDTQGYCMLGDTCPYEHGTDHLIVPTKNDEYDPANATIVVDMQSSPNGTDANFHTHGNGRNNDRGRARGRGHGSQLRGPSRAEFSLVGSNEDRSITTVVVEQIPEKSFAEEQVRDFFSQFGNILEITLQPFKHLAIVRFDDYLSARSAWKSPKPVFDNRFVKVYWFKPDPTDIPGGGPSTMKQEGSPTPMKSDPDFDYEQFSRQQILAQEAHEEKQKKRLQTEDARQALEKQKEELRRRQDEEKAKLMAKLAEKGGDIKPAKNVTETDAKSGANGNNDIDTNDIARTQALRDQLAALEEEARTLGIDPDAGEESSTSFPRGRGRGRGRGSYHGRGSYSSSGGYLSYAHDPSYRGAYHGGYGGGRGRGTVGSSVVRLDNRPKSVAVSGAEFDDAKGEALREYLLHLGPFTSINPTNPANPSSSQTVVFADRFVAEKLFYGTREIPRVGRVEFSWVADPVYVTAHGGVKNKEDPDGDGDMKMGIDIGENGDDEREGREGNERDDIDGEQGANGVNYDIADDMDGWIE